MSEPIPSPDYDPFGEPRSSFELRPLTPAPRPRKATVVFVPDDEESVEEAPSSERRQ